MNTKRTGWLVGAVLVGGGALAFGAQRASKRVAVETPSAAVASAAGVETPAPALVKRTLANKTPYIPPQCYVKTRDEHGKVHNPCFTCHASSRSPNFVDDEDLQLDLTLPEPAQRNPWLNLFVERPASKLSDAEVMAHVQQSNYLAEDGTLTLARQLTNPKPEWDANQDGKWGGYLPDAYFNFDEQGFDHKPDGTYTGWRAVAYFPLPGAFMPTNGSMGDVLVRLPEAFQRNEQGQFDLEIYRTNFAIVEALLERKDVNVAPVSETKLKVDLDGDGKLGLATRVHFEWAPLKGRVMSYVGQARADKSLPDPAAGLFPVGTEFLHSVRYLDAAGARVGLAARMKELRYARKARHKTYAHLRQQALAEIAEKAALPDRVRQIRASVEFGVSNGQGWIYQGFIEDAQGDLRPQDEEEQRFCVGCHSGVGATSDGIFSFERKLEGDAGWYHWSQRGLQGVAEPQRRDGQYEYTLYLEQNGAGDDFRTNAEVQERFFDGEGKLRGDKIEQLHDDVSLLLLPSRERALALDRAYMQLVLEQSFKLGRDAVLSPVKTAYKTAEPNETGVQDAVLPRWASARR